MTIYLLHTQNNVVTYTVHTHIVHHYNNILTVTVLEDNSELREAIKDYALPRTEYFTIGVTIEGKITVYKCIPLAIEMQQYIDILPYCNTLGSDTVFKSYQHIEYHDISMYQHQDCILIHTVFYD